MKEKLYEKNWFIVLMLIFIFPLGLFLMWRYKKWNKQARWIITCAFALMVVIGYTSDDAPVEDKEIEPQNHEEKSKSTEEAPATKSNDSTSSDKKNDEPKKTLTPEKELAKNIKNNVGKEHYGSVTYQGGNLVVNIKNFDGFSRKGMIKNGNRSIVEVLKEIKKSEIEPQAVTVNVMQDVTTSELKDAQANFIHSEWDMDVINRLNSENQGLVMTDTEDYAKSYNVNQNIK